MLQQFFGSTDQDGSSTIDEQAVSERGLNFLPIVSQSRTGPRATSSWPAGTPSTVSCDASRGAALVFMDMPESEETDDYVNYYRMMHERTDGLPSTVTVLAAEDIAFGAVLVQQDGMAMQES